MPYEYRDSGATGLEYLDSLYRYAMVLTRNHAEAEDLVQETYVRALPAMNRLRSDSNLKGWFFKILRNVWLNNLRKRRTAREIGWIDEKGESVIDIADPSTNPYHTLVSKTENERVQAAVRVLSVEFRE